MQTAAGPRVDLILKHCRPASFSSFKSVCVRLRSAWRNRRASKHCMEMLCMSCGHGRKGAILGKVTQCPVPKVHGTDFASIDHTMTCPRPEMYQTSPDGHHVISARKTHPAFGEASHTKQNSLSPSASWKKVSCRRTSIAKSIRPRNVSAY